MTLQPLALRVPKYMGEEARSRATALGVLDGGRKIVELEEYLEIPLTSALEMSDLGELVNQEAPEEYAKPPTPYELIQGAAEIDDDLKRLLPRRWERIGDVLLLKLPGELLTHIEEACRAYAQVLGVKSVLDMSGRVEGPWRIPRYKLLWGTDTDTVHVENGIRFRLDPRKVMFSSGNVSERIRMSKVCEPGEVVVDLFAGIGYFSLPMALHGKASTVYACELNPTAHEYLVDNVRINEAHSVVPLLGDCREVAPEGVADRVVLGYLRETRLYLPKAIKCLKEGGWVHYHEACPDRAVSCLSTGLKEAAEGGGRRLKREVLHRVKRYAPGVSHWVLDALIS